MVELIQADLYRYGIRLMQCTTLHGCCLPNAMTPVHGGTHDIIAADDIAHVRTAFSLLGQALKELAIHSRVEPSITRPAFALIRSCRDFWRKWLKADFYNWDGICIDDAPVNDAQAKLVKVGLRIASVYGNGKSGEDWLRLGRAISSFGLILSGLPRQVGGAHPVSMKRRRPQPPADHQRGHRSWYWVSRDEVYHLADKLNQDVHRLCPDISTEEADVMRLLPYDPDLFWPWFRVEFGLQNLAPPRGQRQDTKPKPLQSEPPATAHLSLQIFLKPPHVILNGIPHALPDEECAVFLQEIQKANGASVSGTDIAEKHPGFPGDHPTRVFDRLREHSKTLAGIVISRTGKGYRLSPTYVVQ